MTTREVVAAVVAVALMAAYLAPIVFKMKDFALTGVIVLGLVVMLADLWQSLKRPED